VGAWAFDEASGTVAADSSDSGNDGTISGATHTSAGKFGRALNFDGRNDLVTIKDAPALNPTNGMTLEAWVKPTAIVGRWQTVALKAMGDDMAYGLYADTDMGGPSANANPTVNSVAVAQSPIAPTWTHLTATYDGLAIRLYVDGVREAIYPLQGRLRMGDGPLQIGGNTIWSEWFGGTIDEVRLYNRALGASEIATDMKSPVPPG
jgi:Concanavalin A-like lectin/glucanases superfamily